MARNSIAIAAKIMDLLVDMICVVDREGRYVFVSAASETLLGYTPDEMLGRNMVEFMHPDDRERTLANAREVMAGKSHSDFENRYIRKDGRIVDIMWSARWSEEDGVRLAVARDVTALKRGARRQEALLRISEVAQSSQDITTLLRGVHRAVAKLLPAERFFVALAEAEKQQVWFPFFYDGGERRADALVLRDGMLLAEVIRGGRGIIANSNHSAGEVTEAHRDNERGHWIGAPMSSPTGRAGAVVMQQSTAAFGYSDQDLELLQFVATQIASAIERKRQEARLRHMAHHDPLTNLPNRTLFHDRVETALRRARREGEQLALLYLDLRDFKVVNDELGHAAGDEVLGETARRLIACLRESDTVARIGGDEFTVLVNNIRTPADIDVIIAKLRAAVAAPLEVSGEILSLAVDIGAALFPDHGEEPELLLRNADADMYHAKRSAPSGARAAAGVAGSGEER